MALIEVLVTLRANPEFYPTDFQLLRIESGDIVSETGLAQNELSRIDPYRMSTTQKVGDAWLASGSSALLRVPSIPSPESWNYLLNPLHPDAASIKVEWAKRLTYDRRPFHLAG